MIDFNKDIDFEMSDGGAHAIPIFAEIHANGDDKLLKEKELKDVPVLALRNMVLFPGMTMPVMVGRSKSLNAIKESQRTGEPLAVVCQIDSEVEDPDKNDLYPVGTVAEVIKVLKLPDDSTNVILHGRSSFVLEDITSREPYLRGNISLYKEKFPKKNDGEFEAIISSIKELTFDMLNKMGDAGRELKFAISNIDDPVYLIHFLATNIPFDPRSKQALLQESDIKNRAYHLFGILTKEAQLIDLKASIQLRTREDLSQQQREHFLQQQIRTIQEELGTNDDDIPELERRAKEKKWDENTQKHFDKELKKLERLNQQSPDYSTQYAYLDTMLNLPWNEYTTDNFNLKKVEAKLNRDHYGLENVKDRILEHLSVLKLRGDLKAPIICLYGPPGVGKTSLGRSIAEALHRKYERISLGGLHDEAEIRGHRRTYIGAMPGRIVEAMMKCNSCNPVIVLDEIDKVGQDFKGDPASALLEVLDPEQNGHFHDNYLDVDYDLSKVLFIATANNLSTIPRPLLDRMEVIELSGYITEEKIEIAKRHLIPRELENTGLSTLPAKPKFNKATIEKIIEQYTRESGVRQLEKQINKAMRKLAYKRQLDGTELSQKVTPELLEDLLGKPPFYRDIYQGNNYAGVVTGLAWTSVGGEILFIETSLSKGKGSKLTLTGNLGDVMKESAILALEYVKAHAETLGIDYRIFDNWNIHIHVPEGATPKDGPSAGITIATSIASALTQRKVRKNTAMTGEITLRGKVLPVGGIKEKILAAKRAGITDIVLCQENEKDILEIPDMYLTGVKFHYVENVQDVWNFALTKEIVEKPLTFDIEEEKEQK